MSSHNSNKNNKSNNKNNKNNKNNTENPQGKKSTSKFLKGVIGSLVASGIFLLSRFKICKSNQYLVRTGLGIKDILVSKKGVQWPFQEAAMIDMNPTTHRFELHNMSKGKVEFKLPVVFTIGPEDPHISPELFQNYAKTMNNIDEYEIGKLIQGVIEGETRGLTSELTVEEIFTAKDEFREKVVKKIQEDLHKLGLKIYNANIQEMADFDDKNKYFEYRKKRAIETANYEAQKDVAKARRDGEIGVKEQERDTRIKIAEMDAEAKTKENLQQELIFNSNAKLSVVESESRRTSEFAVIQTENDLKIRNEKLMREVETNRGLKKLEELRADQLAKTTVEAEMVIKEAMGKAKSILIVAEAEKKSKELNAQGNYAMLSAEAKGYGEIFSYTGDNADVIKLKMLLQDNVPSEMAKYASKAMQGLKPQVSIWNQGKSDGSNDNPFDTFMNGFKSMAPFLDGLQKHTGANFFPLWGEGNGVSTPTKFNQNSNNIMNALENTYTQSQNTTTNHSTDQNDLKPYDIDEKSETLGGDGMNVNNNSNKVYVKNGNGEWVSNDSGTKQGINTDSESNGIPSDLNKTDSTVESGLHQHSKHLKSNFFDDTSRRLFHTLPGFKPLSRMNGFTRFSIENLEKRSSFYCYKSPVSILKKKFNLL